MKTIVLAGPDGNGKTTFAQEMIDKYRLNYFRGNKHLNNNRSIQYKIMKFGDTIIDRTFLIDDFVYGGNEAFLDECFVKDLREQCIVVYDYVEPELVARRVMHRDKLLEGVYPDVLHRTKEIQERYKIYFERTGIKPITSMQLVAMLEENNGI